MGAITAAVIAIAGVILGWVTIEIACKPCLEKGREAIDRNLNPDYDPDEHNHIQTPLNPNPAAAAVNIDDDDDLSISTSSPATTPAIKAI